MLKFYRIFIVFSFFIFNLFTAGVTSNPDSLNVKKTKTLVQKSISAALKPDIFKSLIVADPETDKEIGIAIGAFDEVQKKGNFTHTINPNELTELPIGLSEKKSSVEYSLVVTKVKFTPEFALINVYARVTTPQQGIEGGKKILYFGAEGVKLSYGGKIVGDAKLSLLGNVNMPFNKNQWLLTLEGGKINKIGGESTNENTYVIIDCDGVKELSLKGNVQISRNVLVPLDATGKMLPEISVVNGLKLTNRVRGDFSVKASDWNDLLVKVSLSPFAITKQTQNEDKGYFSFFVNNAVLDLSDLRTDPDVVFPQYYATHGYLVAGTETWRGLFVQSLYIGLPQEIKTEDHVDTRVSFQANNVIIDSYGVSGSFSANNVFPLDKGVTSANNAWKYSLDKIGVDLAASKIVGANLEGKIQLPVQKIDTSNNSTIPNTLGYVGMMTEEEYLISVSTLSDINFDIWSAKATIAQGSSVELRVRNREFLPKAILNGSLAINGNASADDNIDGPEKKDVDFKGIKFEGLTLQTRMPFITAQYFGVEGEQKLANFPASIKNIVVVADGTQANLGFEITVGLQDERFSATGGMFINGLITSENNRQKWKYDGFSLTKLNLNNVDIGVATVSGSLQIMRKDPLYGNGFMAALSAKIKALEGVEVTVNAAFGNSTFKYWGFEGSVDKLNIVTPLGVKITGFTGGAFYRMIPDRDMTLLNKSKALVMRPDNTIGLALRAGVYGAIKGDKVATFMAGFNISTNPGGGLSQIGFTGEALIMSDLTAFAPDVMVKMKEKFQGVVGKSKFLTDLKDNSHVNSFLDANAVDESYPTEVTVPSKIYGKLAMNYDFNNKIFHANLDVYVNTPGGLIQGIGANGRAGYAVMHIAKDEWYLHIGTPTDMIGLKVGFGKFALQSGSYFMVGTKIPASPAPPIEVANILGVELNDIDYMSHLNTLGDGKGFAFGTHLKFDTGDMTALFLYARFQAGLGTDIMLKYYGEGAKCSNRGGDQIGVNGWYANGQAYAYLQGELGIKIKLWFIKKNIPIIKAAAAALLQAKGPNPYWARGYLGGNYNLLGGLVKGSFRFKLEFGEECILENASVLGGMKIISDFQPKKDDTDVDVFAIPQATFSVRVNEPITIPEDDGDHTYKVVVERMTIIDDQGKEIKGVIEYANSKDVADFISDDILPPNKKLKAIAQVSFMEKKNGIYEVVNVDGKKAIELEEREFTTGSAPTAIPLSNIKYAYPVAEQENYYKGETNKGYIQLKRGQDYLFEDTNWQTQTNFKTSDSELPSGFAYDTANNMVTFDVPNISKQKDYDFSIVAKNTNVKSGTNVTETTTQTTSNGNDDSSVTTETTTKYAQSNSKDGEINRLTYSFRTSKYNTLEDKLSALNFNPLWVKVNSEIVFLQNNMNAQEYFDLTEISGSKYTDNKPLINITALMEDNFAGKFKSLFYNAYPIDQLVLNRETDDTSVGIPPTNAFPVFTSYVQYLGDDKSNGFLMQTFPYKYDLFSYYKADWYELVSKAASKYVGAPANTRPAVINTLLQSNFGVIPEQKYKVKAKYILPGNKAGSEKLFNYEFK